MSEPTPTEQYAFTPYHAAFIQLNLGTDDALIEAVESLCFASGEGCLLLNVDFALGELDTAATLTPGDEALRRLCQQADTADYADVLVYLG